MSQKIAKQGGNRH